MKRRERIYHLRQKIKLKTFVSPDGRKGHEMTIKGFLRAKHYADGKQADEFLLQAGRRISMRGVIPVMQPSRTAIIISPQTF